jgi:HEPN/Toprim N-terminal domain 1
MGSMITLGVGKMEIDWGKNDHFTDHSSLFLPSDVQSIPYYYAGDVVELQEGLSRELGSVKRRLDLLGYSPESVARKYQEHLDMVSGYYSEFTISFEQFRSIVTSIDLERESLKYTRDDLATCLSRHLARDPDVQRHPAARIDLSIELETFLENLDPYIPLRLLAENDKNKHQLVQWRYADVVQGGWVERDQVVASLSDKSRILVVTEGSSDSFIIQRAVAALRPDVADFLDFVDMEEHYPFTGTGNLFRFCQGLSRIKIQNNVLVVF